MFEDLSDHEDPAKVPSDVRSILPVKISEESDNDSYHMQKASGHSLMFKPIR